MAARHGVIMVWGAVLVFAAANSIVQLLADLGVQYPVEGRNAISFCNVLFVGNLCAVATLFAIYHRQWTPDRLRELSREDWASLVVLALLSGALAPALIFLAIENTTVTNVVLVGRVEPFLLLFLSATFLKEVTSRWTMFGAIIVLVGVGLAFLLQNSESGLMIGKGEGQAALGAALLAVSTVFSKLRLSHIPMGIFTVVRTGLGTVVFFVAAIYLFGPEHFMDAFNPFLWQWMLVYGAIIIVGGQLLWFTGVRNSSSADVSLAISFSPVAGIAFAYVLVGEQPGLPILAGGMVIVAGIALAQGGSWRERRHSSQSSTPELIEAEGRVSFKGI